jgi:hypothetical protein
MAQLQLLLTQKIKNKIMKTLFAILILSTSIILSSCKDECDPGQLPADDAIYVTLKNNNGSYYINYTASVLPDSVKVTNLSTNTLAPASLLGDTILVIPGYNKTNNTTTKFKIAKGNILKPDTVEVVATITNIADNCGTPYPVIRFSSFKINNSLKCTNCFGSLIQSYTRP